MHIKLRLFVQHKKLTLTSNKKSRSVVAPLQSTIVQHEYLLIA